MPACLLSPSTLVGVTKWVCENVGKVAKSVNSHRWSVNEWPIRQSISRRQRWYFGLPYTAVFCLLTAIWNVSRTLNISIKSLQISPYFHTTIRKSVFYCTGRGWFVAITTRLTSILQYKWTCFSGIIVAICLLMAFFPHNHQSNQYSICSRHLLHTYYQCDMEDCLNWRRW